MRNKVLAAAVAISVAALPAVSARAKKSPDPSAAFKVKLTRDQQVLHALDRLSFGPRPGDSARVKKMGVKKWIDLQLHPERIAENPVLEAKLQPLESLRMTQAEAVQSYPTPQFIRAVATGRQKTPGDPVLRAAIERYLRRFQLKKDPGNIPQAADFEPVLKLDQILNRDQIQTLRRGTPDQKRELLAGFPDDKIDDFVVALTHQGGLRGQLFGLAPVPLQRKMLLAVSPQQVIAYDLTVGKLDRAIYSNRQLQEELVDFWYNHFNVFLDKGADRYLVPAYERDAIRPHVLGKFRDLLEATAKSPAMLFYLDNWQSVAPHPPNPHAKNKRASRGLNENYGRELMELHTLGVDGGYTQKDVIEVARCFTGWTIRDPRQGGTFYFNDRVHDKGEKVVLGVTIPAGGGIEDGEKVLHILASHPSTAKFISTKLAKRFVADNPPPALIDRMAKTYLSSDGDLRAVMKTMLSSKEFWSEGAYHAKIKTPFEMIVSSVRALDADVDLAFPLVNQIAQLGEPLYRKLEPTGYSNANTEWINSASLLARMNFGLALAQNRFPGVKVDAARLDETKSNQSSWPPDPSGSADRIARILLATAPMPATRAALDKALQQQTAAHPHSPPTPALIAGLVIGSPDFQRR